MAEFEQDLTHRRYKLKCKLKFYQTTVTGDVSNKGKSYERRLALLIPQEGDERSRFLTAWLPEVEGEYYEMSGFIDHPVDSPVRLSIHRRDKKSPESHYLFVMSKGVEDILQRCREGQLLSVTTFSAAEEDEADYALDSNLDIEAVET